MEHSTYLAQLSRNRLMESIGGVCRDLSVILKSHARAIAHSRWTVAERIHHFSGLLM